MLSRKSRRRLLSGLAITLFLLAAVIGRPLIHLTGVIRQDRNEITPPPSGYVDDVSRLNQTQIAEVWQIPSDTAAAEEQLRDLLKRAKESDLAVSIAGARHSMGGHTISSNGIVIDMTPFRQMELNEDQTVLTVQAGALWAEIIPYLDKVNRSVSVMQSNNSFSVGGSLSVNCHGWQFGKPPIASTAKAFRLMLADGSIVRCSRDENQELFSLTLGGYGLFGIILDAELVVVANQRLRLQQFVVPIDRALSTYQEQLHQQPDVTMVYARLSIVPEELFQEAIIAMFSPDEGPLPDLKAPESHTVKRALFRGSAFSDYGKELRWTAETRYRPYIMGTVFSRNQLLNESVDWFVNRRADSTDVLHEYFVPVPRLTAFLGDLRRIIQTHRPDLLNVTLRDVHTDEDTFLRYADQPMIAFVMFFNQLRTQEADTAMQTLTQELIDAALKHGGRYYLPYRLHATPEQFQQAYPQSAEFFERKRHYDPDERFQNQFYLKYGHANRDKQEPPEIPN